MNGGMKKFFRSFLWINGIIVCLTLLFVGSITVKQRTQYNMYMSDYAICTLKNNNKKLQMNLDDKKMISFDLSFFNKAEEYEEYLLFSPLGSSYYLIKTARQLLE